MSDVIEVDIQEHFPVEIIEVHVDENAAQDAIDAAALAQQTLEFCQDIVANLGVVNTIFVNNGFTKVGSEFTGLAGTQWNINGTNYSKAANQTITIPLCAAGMVRTDRIVLDTNNNFLLVQGVEVTVNPVAESKPVNTLDYTFIPVNDTEVGEPDTPTIGNIFNKKDYDKVYTFNASGTDVEIPFNVSGFSTIELTGSVTSVKGFSFTDLSANPTLAEWPHKGKPFILINRSGHDIELKHNNLTTIVPFNFDSGSGIVIPNNGKFLLKLMTNAVIDIFKSWVDLSGKLDKVTTVDVEKVYIKNADGTQGMKPVSEFGGGGGTSPLVDLHWASVSFSALNTWRGWTRGVSISAAPSTSYGTGTLPTTSGLLYADTPVIPINGTTQINRITLNVRIDQAVRTYQAYIVVADYNCDIGNEINAQVLVNQTFTTVTGSNLVDFTINSHTLLNDKSVIYVFFRQTAGSSVYQWFNADLQIY